MPTADGFVLTGIQQDVAARMTADADIGYKMENPVTLMINMQNQVRHGEHREYADNRQWADRKESGIVTQRLY